MLFLLMITFTEKVIPSAQLKRNTHISYNLAFGAAVGGPHHLSSDFTLSQSNLSHFMGCFLVTSFSEGN